MMKEKIDSLISDIFTQPLPHTTCQVLSGVLMSAKIFSVPTESFQGRKKKKKSSVIERISASEMNQQRRQPSLNKIPLWTN